MRLHPAEPSARGKDLASGVTRRVDSDAYGSTALAGPSEDGRRVVLGSTAYADGTHTARLADLRTGRVRRIGPDGAAALAADGTARHVLLSEGDALTLLDVRTGHRRPVAPTGRPARRGLPGRP